MVVSVYTSIPVYENSELEWVIRYIELTDLSEEMQKQVVHSAANIWGFHLDAQGRIAYTDIWGDEHIVMEAL